MTDVKSVTLAKCIHFPAKHVKNWLVYGIYSKHIPTCIHHCNSKDLGFVVRGKMQSASGGRACVPRFVDKAEKKDHMCSDISSWFTTGKIRSCLPR
jgi:hypothetical protein